MLAALDTSKDWFANPWWVIGIGGQALFAIRFIVQWIATERARRVVVPLSFWYISIAAAMITMVYGLLDRDVVVVMGQTPGLVVYVRNLVIFRRQDVTDPCA
jgi:lipid-A-disaccharide synthase-like uncharacterized protein